MHHWKNTQIWRQLSLVTTPEADPIKACLITCLPAIEQLLNSAGTTPLTFTLHDADHSYRVAERMWQLIPKETQSILSAYELALLLLSAYLHDIGMSPSQNKLSAHQSYLDGNSTALSPEEGKQFQQYLDEEPHLSKDKALIFYSRHKHNDWSEEWIRNNLSNLQPGNYTNWLNDLILICKSHHEGLEALKKESFAPLRLNNNIIHKRYLAMCLRMADVMEIDPERAPEILIGHRGIQEQSLSHWLKEKFTSIDLVNNIIAITARPEQAFIHKAVLDVAAQIERESQLCHLLIADRPLNICPPLNDLPHQWLIHPIVHKDIKEAGNYEFIDGTFQPNPLKTLQLLAGTQLYQKPIMAVRELLQNAFDAVKFQIGYKVLEDTPDDLDKLRTRFTVSLKLYEENGYQWLTCTDNGIGMSKDTIKKCLLIAGAPKRRELIELERACKLVGYDPEATGQFGIGVMSYFMIADQIIIHTKAVNESQGYAFTIDGLESFGELRRLSNIKSGTTVKLRLKSPLSYLGHFLKTNITHIPCNLTVELPGESIVHHTPGWIDRAADLEKNILIQFDDDTSSNEIINKDFYTRSITRENARSEAIARALRPRLATSISFLTKESTFKDNAGRFRISIPVYKNLHGDAFTFLYEQDGTGYLQEIRSGLLFYKKYNDFIFGWKGMAVESEISVAALLPYKNVHLEIDLTTTQQVSLSVSRLNLNVEGELIEQMIKEIKTAAIQLILENQTRFNTSIYAFLNQQIIQELPVSAEHLYWRPNNTATDEELLEPVTYPILLPISLYFGKNKQYKGQPLRLLEGFPQSIPDEYEDESNEINVFCDTYKLDIIICHPSDEMGECALILAPPNKINEYMFIGNTAKFPPGWENVFGSLYEDRYRNNKLVLNEEAFAPYIHEEDFLYIQGLFYSFKTFNEESQNSILQTKERCICFIAFVLIREDQDIWSGILLTHPEFAQALWIKLFGTVEHLIYAIQDSLLIKITGQSWNVEYTTQELTDRLPIPSMDWAIE